MDVLQVITDKNRRGAQVFAADLHGALEHRQVGVTTVALAPGDQAAVLPYEALGPKRWSRKTLSSLRQQMESSDLVVAHGSTTLPACAIAGVGLMTPIVYRQISQQLFWADTALKRFRVRAALRRASGVVALWSGAAEVLQHTFGVDAERIHIVPNGVPASRVPETTCKRRTEARASLGISGDVPVVLSLGALVPEKGVDAVVRACARLGSVKLLVVGEGTEAARLQALSASLNLDTYFAGALDDVAPVLAAADVIALASRGGDSMPAVLIEAGFAGLPAVAAPVEGIVDIVRNGETGFLTDVEDEVAFAGALRRAIADRSRLGAQARVHCFHSFEIGVVAEQWKAILEATVLGNVRVS